MAELSFLSYIVSKINFSIGEDFGTGPIQLEVNINRSLEDKKYLTNENKVSYTLALSTNIENENKETGFCAEVVIKGKFQLSFDNQLNNISNNNLMINNATAILFPYLRSAISSICLTAGIPPFILPIVNVTKDFNDEFSKD